MGKEKKVLTMQNKSLEEKASFHIVINKEDLPTIEILDEIKESVIFAYPFISIKVSCGSLKSDRTDVCVCIESFDIKIPIMAALEMFLYMLGNVKIYKKVVTYKRYGKKSS